MRILFILPLVLLSIIEVSTALDDPGCTCSQTGLSSTNSYSNNNLANNGTTCTQCSSGCLPYEDNCIQCSISMCSYCKTSNKCQQCMQANGYQLSTDQSSCIWCVIPNCLTCSTDGVCQRCKTTSLPYQPSMDYSQCVLCNTSNCLKCPRDNSCGRCQSGYQKYPVQDSTTINSTCVLCNNVQFCKVCSKDNFCQTCLDGYQNDENGSCFICRYPCSTCKTKGKCLTCSTPDYYEKINSLGQCVQVQVTNCIQYSSNNQSKCTKCSSSYNLVPQNNTCVAQCNQNCASCTSETKNCTVCATGYSLQPSNKSTCILCPSGCDVCTDKVTCQQASTGFYILNGQPKKCVAYCKQCQSQTKCFSLIKSSQYVLTTNSLNQSILVKCASSCLTCSSQNTDQCLACKDEYYLQSATQICLRCGSGCKTCNPVQPTQCLTCYSNMYKTNQLTCALCSENCLSCVKLSSVYQCQACQDYYYLNTKNQCVDKCLSNCVQCASSIQCSKCSDGYTVVAQQQYTPVQKICLPCIASCRTCALGQPEKCLNCGDGFYLSGSKCIRCPLLCKSCTAKGCDQCIDGYFVNSILGCSKNCIFPCSNCFQSNPTSCKQCIGGYTYSLTDQSCTPSISCTGSCSICPFGYYLQNKNCKPCTTRQCSSCLSTGTCFGCFDGYYLNASNSCQTCSSKCLKCQSSTICSQCQQGYFKMQKNQRYQCIACANECKICQDQPTKCYSCKDGYNFGYYGTDWKCGKKERYWVNVVLDTTLSNFLKKMNNFTLDTLASINSTDPNDIIYTKIEQGSVILQFNIYQPTSTNSIATTNLQSYLASSSLAGMPIISSAYSDISPTSLNNVPQKTEIFPVVAPSSSSSSPVAIIVGVVVGVLVTVGLVILAIVCYRKHKTGEYGQNSQMNFNRNSIDSHPKTDSYFGQGQNQEELDGKVKIGIGYEYLY